MKKALIVALFVLLFGSFTIVNACSCGGYPAVCESYGEANAVFIGSVRTVENTMEKVDDGEEFIKGQKAWVQVDKVFKGTVSGELLFRSYGSSCDTTYKEGQRWLFYAYFKKEEKAWHIRACDRSTLLDGAREDLLYLNALPESAKTTRISGTIKHYEDDPERGFSLVNYIMGAKVSILGPKNYEVFTDANGSFEVYGAPAGLYEIKQEIQLGLKLRFPISYGATALLDRKDLPGGRVEGKFRHKLQENSCVSMGFVLSADNAISGKVIGADGKPMSGVCLELVPADLAENKRSPYFRVFDCTEEDGSYVLDDMPAGRYLIVANYHEKISASEPFRETYYPGTLEKEKATVITLAQGDRRTDYDIHIPSQVPTQVLRGLLLFSDGKPVSDGYVRFEGMDVPEGYDGNAQTAVDEQGRFELTVLKGIRGKIRGEISAYEGKYLKCPVLDDLARKQGGFVWDVSTKPIDLEVHSDREGIILKFPFPYCAKAKPE